MPVLAYTIIPVVAVIAGVVGLIGGAYLLLIAAFVSMIFLAQGEVRLNAVGPIAAAPGAVRQGVTVAGCPAACLAPRLVGHYGTYVRQVTTRLTAA